MAEALGKRDLAHGASAYNDRMSTRGLVAALVIALFASSAAAQGQTPRPVPVRPPKRPVKPPPKPPVIDMDKFGIVGKDRKALLVYFLERANEELERATLEKRSFVPELIKTVDAETL